MPNNVQRLARLGQSIWLDNIERRLLASGGLDGLITDGLLGMTSNPTIFEKAIGNGADYDDELVVVLDDWIDGTGTTPDQVAENLKKTGMKPMTGPPRPLSPSLPLGEDGDGRRSVA